jgi:hypothetical protein
LKNVKNRAKSMALAPFTFNCHSSSGIHKKQGER